ncbi:RNA polymerase factor sigma-54 [Clostridium tarantellae]|nr:RNA polymerase factor sigma-54 [Clostridium tarantellae]
MDFNLNLSQEQKLIMTQQMQLSIKLLQMSTYDLREYIEKEFLENPVLEAQYEILEEYKKDKDRLDYKELIKYLESDNYGSQSYGEYDENKISPFTFLSSTKSLIEYLHEQILELPIDNYIKSICDYIIESLNNKGYLDISLEELSKEMSCSMKILEKAIIIIHNLEPAGIGARDLKECLILQLIRKGEQHSKACEIVNNYLDELANNKYNIIAKKLKISIKEAQKYGDLIKSLEPKPSRGFYTGEDVKFIIPDAEVRKIDGEFFIIMNDNVLPRLSINNVYKDLLEHERDKNAVNYIKDKMGKAVFLIKSINQRKTTLYKVLEKIVEKQKEYFSKGEKYLIPMTLKEIADELQIHESTVSRAIREKFILTTFGTIKIKKLFTIGLQSNNFYNTEADISVNRIKNEIENLISEENKSKPMSDQFICDLLNDKGINISRRTVAKYREELGIKSSSKRKRF